MNLHRTILALLLIAIIASCERRVEVRPTAPLEVTYCSAPDDLEGIWRSDSIGIISHIDSTDTIFGTVTPTLTYFMEMSCPEDSLFLLWYENFSGVRTEVVRSRNFLANDSSIYAFSPLEASTDTSAATFSMHYTRQTEGRIAVTLVEYPNPGQRTETSIFFRKE